MLLIQVHASTNDEQPEYLLLVDGGNNKTLMSSETYAEGGGMRAAFNLREQIPGAEIQDLRETEGHEPPQREPQTEEERAAAEEAARVKAELADSQARGVEAIREAERAQASEQ